jgi:hypothetical protein
MTTAVDIGERRHVALGCMPEPQDSNVAFAWDCRSKGRKVVTGKGG